jgi:hypothetical protein
VVSLGTGGALFKPYRDTAKDKISLIVQAVTECRKTAENMQNSIEAMKK